MRKRDRCESGYQHIWESRGLDIEDDELVSTYRCEPCGQERSEVYDMPDYSFRRNDDQWDVVVDGEVIGNVFKERQRIGFGNGNYRKGRTIWCATGITDEDYSTRKEAAADMYRRYQRGRDF